MKKLTEEKCQELIGALVYAQVSGGISTKEELYLQALQIALESMGSGWIKCSDRMPSKESAVLVSHSCGEVWCAVRTSHGWDDGLDGDQDDITHWMPLPTPPEAN